MLYYFYQTSKEEDMLPDSDQALGGLEAGEAPVSRKMQAEEIARPRSGLGIVAVALGIYLVAAALSVVFLLSKWLAYDHLTPFVFVVISLPTVFPLAFTVGMVAAYQNNYQKAGKGTGLPERVTREAVAWRRYAIPLALLNSIIVLILGVLLAEDIKATGEAFQGGIFTEMGIMLGRFSVPFEYGITQVNISSLEFYLAYGGFGIYFLEASRRRFSAKSLVPDFYIALAFKWIYVSIAIVIVHLAMDLGSDLFGFSEALSNTVSRPEARMLVAFLIGIFPEEWINLLARKVRGWFGVAQAEPLPLSMLDGIDYTLEAYLHEQNIDSMQTLAGGQNLEEISRRTNISPDILEGWHNQARLFHVLGDKEIIARFRRIAVNDINDVAVFTKDIKLSNKIPEKDFGQALIEKDVQKAQKQPQYWSVIIRVLLTEYRKHLREHDIPTTTGDRPKRARKPRKKPKQ